MNINRICICASLTTAKRLIVWTKTSCELSLEKWVYKSILSCYCLTCIRMRKHQSDQNMATQVRLALGKESDRDVSYHHICSIFIVKPL